MVWLHCLLTYTWIITAVTVRRCSSALKTQTSYTVPVDHNTMTLQWKKNPSSAIVLMNEIYNDRPTGEGNMSYCIHITCEQGDYPQKEIMHGTMPAWFSCQRKASNDMEGNFNSWHNGRGNQEIHAECLLCVQPTSGSRKANNNKLKNAINQI